MNFKLSALYERGNNHMMCSGSLDVFYPGVFGSIEIKTALNLSNLPIYTKESLSLPHG